MTEPVLSSTSMASAAHALGRGELSSTELSELCLARIEALNPSLGAFWEVTAIEARAQARDADSAHARGHTNGALHGLPIAIKDNIDTAGTRTTSGSPFFEQYVPRMDATVIARLRAAGAVLVGKTSMHELAYGGTTQNRHYGSCRNAWNLECVPGGSSGGSAVAVAAGMCFASLGTDTGGSIRLPAALNGVCGLRPTQGAVSNHGVFPISWSFDTVGPIAGSVDVLGLMMSVLQGLDRSDPGSVARPIGNEPSKTSIHALRIGRPADFYFEDADSGIVTAVDEAIETLSRLGAKAIEVSMQGAADARAAAAIMLGSESYAIHRERLQSQPELFGDDVRGRLLEYQATSGEEYAAALQDSRIWRRNLELTFQQVDVVITPVVGVVAPRIDDPNLSDIGARHFNRLTIGWTLAGLPALAIPCGFSDTGLPISMQVAAAPWQESLLIQVGTAYQDATNWHLRSPTAVTTD